MNTEKTIEATLQSLCADDEPGLTILVTQHGQTILETYAGLANLKTGEPLTATHQLGIASLSKQFTGMAVLFLCAESKLDLDETTTTYFPDLPLGGRTISLRQLLSHTSGLPELTQTPQFMADINQPPQDAMLPQRHCGHYAHQPQFPPDKAARSRRSSAYQSV